MSEPKPSEKMSSIGIVQEGDPILREVAPPFDLPAEAEDARRVIAELHAAIRRADTIHNFAKGMGVAAPQLGIRRAAAIVRTSDGKYITLLNPQIVSESAATDEQYEGCWSFFDVRGSVPRPRSMKWHTKTWTGISNNCLRPIGSAAGRARGRSPDGRSISGSHAIRQRAGTCIRVCWRRPALE
jgi:peptide deformylase